MAVVGRDIIEKWVKIVNAEYGLSDRDEESIDYFMKLRDCALFDYTNEYYLVCLPSVDMWGEKILSVVSYYILPEYRNYKMFKKIQDRIEELAKINKVDYIYQGSHLNPKLNKVLYKMGYVEGILKKEIRNG